MSWFKNARERLLAKEREEVRTSVRALPSCTGEPGCRDDDSQRELQAMSSRHARIQRALERKVTT